MGPPRAADASLWFGGRSSVLQRLAQHALPRHTPQRQAMQRCGTEAQSLPAEIASLSVSADRVPGCWVAVR